MTSEDPTSETAMDEVADLKRQLENARREARSARAAAADITDLLDRVLDNMGNGLVVFDADARLVLHNRRFAEMYRFEPGDLTPGTTREQLIRRGTERMWPADPNPAARFFRADGEDGTSEIRLPDGSVYERIVIPSPDGGAVITHTDVTERKRVEQELREQREVLQDVFDNVGQGLAAYDEDARVITWNRKYQEYLILNDDQIYRGCPVWDLVMLHAERGTYGSGDRVTLEKQVQQRIDRLMSGQVIRFDYVNGDGIPMEAVSAPRPQGGFVVTYADITERKRAETEIIRARDDAEAANRAKSSFLAAMSHEIRTPMNGVLGLIEILQHSELNEDQRLLVETVNGSANALLRIIDDILDFSKIEAGRMELESVPLSLKRLVEQTMDTIRPSAETKGLKLSLEISGALPGTVVGDPVRLRQVLLNLLSNAVKFTATGTIAVEIDVTPAPEGDDRIPITLSVLDSGIGLSPEQQSDLFTPFSQAESSTTRRFGGTGLGLSICRRLVELMGGEIGVTSTLGRGARFHFTVPFETNAVEERPPQVLQPTPPGISPRAGISPRDSADSSRILVAEDTAINRFVVERQLSEMGYSADYAANGREAFELWRAADYDLMLVDCHMPEVDGFELTRMVREAEPDGVRIPIIALTANAMAGESDRCLAAGMDDFLAKPAKFARMAETLSRWLGRPEGSS